MYYIFASTFTNLSKIQFLVVSPITCRNRGFPPVSSKRKYRAEILLIGIILKCHQYFFYVRQFLKHLPDLWRQLPPSSLMPGTDKLRERESWKRIVIFWLVEAVEVVEVVEAVEEVDHLGSFWGGWCIESTSVSSPVKSTRLDRQRGKESVLLLPGSTTTTRRN